MSRASAGDPREEDTDPSRRVEILWLESTGFILLSTDTMEIRSQRYGGSRNPPMQDLSFCAVLDYIPIPIGRQTRFPSNRVGPPRPRGSSGSNDAVAPRRGPGNSRPPHVFANSGLPLRCTGTTQRFVLGCRWSPKAQA